MLPRVKICCIQNEEEARLAIACGASALGLVGAMPSGPGPIPDEVIGRVAATVPPPIATFLLTSETTAAGIAAQHARCRTSVIQLCDHLPSSIYAELRALLPAIKLVQVVHVEGPESVEYALAAAEHVDALLLDSGRLSLAVRELGGTGRVHDWKLSRQIRDQARVPIFLAGGLRPENVRRALVAVQPFGLDLCSGVRTNDRLDEAKLRAFMAAIA
ncbi:MAG: phosphoribosylanthranilate isomerase [Verrucomicrobia bacterium]|nr:phosphoribosylanthranilate isomerase [Verrucomicrobiota bacterium]